MLKIRDGNVLKNKNFVLLWIGQFISNMGNQFQYIAAMWYVLQITGSPFKMGMTVICETIPVIAFSPFAGIMADKLSRKKIIIISDLINGILAISLFTIIYLNIMQLWMIYLITALMSISSAFFGPAIKSAIPTIVDKENLLDANNLSQLLMGITGIAGPALAAVFISTFSIKILFMFNGISFFIAAILELFIFIPLVMCENKEKSNLKEDFTEGFLYSLKNKNLLQLIIVGGIIINFFLAPISVYIPIFAKNILHMGSTAYSEILMALTAGNIATTLVVPFLKKKFDYFTLVFIGFTMEGISLTLMYFSTNIYSTIAIMALFGASVCICNVSLGTVLQSIIPNYIMGRVSSVFSMICSIANPIGLFIGSYILDKISISYIFLVSGIIVSVAGLSTISIVKDHNRNNKVENAC